MKGIFESQMSFALLLSLGNNQTIFKLYYNYYVLIDSNYHWIY